MSKWLVIGISGVSGGGKTTLAKSLYELLNNKKEYNQIEECHLVHQDDYFRPIDYENHLWMPELKHINWDVMGALDMDRMVDDLKKILKNSSNKSSNPVVVETDKVNILIIEGFLILNHKEVRDICDLKFYLDLNKEQCYDRRKDRVYDPPDVPGYFDQAVWSGHLRNKSEVLQYDVEFLDGMRKDLLTHIKQYVDYLLSYN
ncbi:nicotinamide riboside kinase 1 [Ctenocephalides felis]|uniref:nicotinamide riboside kinase 1 n=1 Tax=Ctenocephalides felis TaxID=7515 RepID=UPI000E6E3D4F|nr:nicotinamide riboside kinase 1 [Ctenocephalides felis]